MKGVLCFFLLCATCKGVGWRHRRRCEGTQPGQLTLTGQKDTPDHTVVCPALKAQGNNEKEGMFVVKAFTFLK